MKKNGYQSRNPVVRPVTLIECVKRFLFPGAPKGDLSVLATGDEGICSKSLNAVQRVVSLAKNEL